MQGEQRAGTFSDPPPWPMRIMVLVLAAMAAPALPAAVQAALDQPLAALGWVLLLSAAATLSVVADPRSRYEVTLRAPIAIGACVALAPPLAFFVNLVALVSLVEIRGRPSPWMAAFNHLQFALIAGLTSLVVHARPLGPVAGAVLAVPVYDLTNLAVVALSRRLRERTSLRAAFRLVAAPFPTFASNFLLIGLLAVLTVVLYTEVAPWSLVLLAGPVWLGYSALRSARDASDRAEELAARVRELEVLNELGSSLLTARDAAVVARLATSALRAICADHAWRARITVALDGRLPRDLEPWEVPGTGALVGLPSGLDQRRRMEAETVCSAIGMALVRLGAERELGESQRAQAALAGQILAEGTAARGRVALRVHDEVLPYLAAAQIQADNVLAAASAGDLALTSRLSTAVRDAVQGAIRTLRRVLDDLQRQIIVPGDLVPSINRAAQQARLEHGLTVGVDTDDYHHRISHPTEILLIETVSGLLANVLQHAQASYLSIRLRSDQRAAELDVFDDGGGFDADRVGPGHHGLELMRQRVALAQGRMTLDSAPGEGTKVRVVVPLGTAGTPAPQARTGSSRSRPPRKPNSERVVHSGE
ncbi:MAG: hypothetical protein GEU81_03180 [Nitriliruptorales bacterium]|nr:hypothetical protein [Nitriliruptorales bacterium]